MNKLILFCLFIVIVISGCSASEKTETKIINVDINDERSENNNQEENEVGKNLSPVETLVETISYEGVKFEIINRSNVKWVGSMKFNDDDYTADPSPLVGIVHPLWGEFFENEIINSSDHSNFIAPTAIGVLWFNVENNDLPSGMMMAKEVYELNYESKYNVYDQPADLYLRFKVDADSARLIGKEQYEGFEIIDIATAVVKENGYEVYYPIINNMSLSCLDYHDNDKGLIYAYLHVKKSA